MPGVHVLVADDYGDSREILNIILDAEGYRTTLAADGAEALEKAQQDPPDIILRDVFMPILDGLAATQALKANEQLSRIPVIAYTAKPTDIEGHRDLFFDVLGKPCDPDRLLAVLRRASATLLEGAVASEMG